MSTVASKGRVDRKAVSPGLVSVLTFLMHVVLFLELVYQDETLFKKCRYIALRQMSVKCRE